MIRINLLAVERGAAKRGAALIPAAHRVTIAASLILLATALVIGWWFWSLRHTSQRLDQDLAKAETEMQQLKSVLAQVQTFELRKAQLQQRVSLIEELRRGQAGPVHMVDEMSRALPDRLWLTSLVQKGDDVTVQGTTTSLTGLSDFVANLSNSAWFKKPVEIIDSQTNGAADDLVTFTVKATFFNPDVPALPAKPAKPGKPAAKKR